MKAEVQYNDFIGTAAADISDHTHLENFISSRGIDTERYQAIGASFYAGYSDYFSVSILCIDKDNSTELKKHIVKIGFEKDISKDEFFVLFKIFNVVITQKYGNYEQLEVDEEFHFDDRDTEYED